MLHRRPAVRKNRTARDPFGTYLASGLTVGIGVGGREEDYTAVGADTSTQTMRGMAERVAEACGVFDRDDARIAGTLEFRADRSAQAPPYITPEWPPRSARVEYQTPDL